MLLFGLIFIQIIASLVFNIVEDVGLLGFDQATTARVDIFNVYYDKFYYRMAVYFIGMLGGIYFIEFK